MNIIIPLGGKGDRFRSVGYTNPKPLIKVFNKPMILYVLDNLNLSLEDRLFIIYYNIEKEQFSTIIHEKYPNVSLIELNEQTKGASETIYKGLRYIKQMSTHTKCVLLDCDTFYTTDILTTYRNIDSNVVFYTNNVDMAPIYSYVNLDTNGQITEIAEKHKISDNANTGIYCFNDIDTLYEYSRKVVHENIVSINNECYTSCIIDQMIQNNVSFSGIEIDSQHVFNLGTPVQLEEYISNTHIFLFDLDGTLVLSENIYYDVWKELLHEYNVDLTEEMFTTNISGNSDDTAVQHIWRDQRGNISTNKISQNKDALFIKHLHKIKMVDGLEPFLKSIKENGHLMAVVTNCNRGISELILEHVKLSNYFEFIVVGNECNNPKPYPDPYVVAINSFNGHCEKTIIFEDSKTGILSATGVSPKCVVGIETMYENHVLINCGVDITIKDYLNLTVNELTLYRNKSNKIKTFIEHSLRFSFTRVEINNIKLKGGFISDVIDVKVKTIDDTIMCVAKLENTCDNFLTEMSNALDLYEREYYFYEFISQQVPLRIPQFYGIIYDDSNKKVGVLLENINNENYKLNLNLNTENVSVSFSVIDSLVKLHSKFWNKITPEFTPFHDDYRCNKLKKNNDGMFNPFWNNFVTSKWPIFRYKWSNALTSQQLDKGEYISNNFLSIQEKLADRNLTLCHGDVKSANIFYKILPENNYEPFFIDWQYIVLGKGVQDLVFFMIESFESDRMSSYKSMFKEYYYKQLLENGVSYSMCDYETDFENASYYFPFFVAMWFGTISEDELIDNEFPTRFITQLFAFYVN